MYVVTCCTSSALNALDRLPLLNSPLLDGIKKHLAQAIKLGEEYTKTQNSIRWNKSRVALKKSIKEKLHAFAFDAYSELLDMRRLINEYVKQIGACNLPTGWQGVIASLFLAISGMQKDNLRQIEYKQLSLF